MPWYREWKPYVPVAKRRAKAAAFAAKLAKQEKRTLSPVKVSGRKMAQSFWGQAWCENLERYSDFANRLPRGRTYARNGSVVDLRIERGQIQALVSGSEIYHVSIAIKTLRRPAWKRIKQECSQSIDSLLDLLQGRFDQGVMQRLTQREGGLFPQPAEIEMHCSCPDWAGLCKHVAAVLYGVGVRLDTTPELLFTLRDVDHWDLISQAVAAENLDRTLSAGPRNALAGSDLGELFGIDLDAGVTPVAKPTRRKQAVVAASCAEVATKRRAKTTASPPAKSKRKRAAPRKLPASESTEKSAVKTRVKRKSSFAVVRAIDLARLSLRHVPSEH